MNHIIAFFVTFTLSALVPGLLTLLALFSWKRSTSEHWTERARRLQPIRNGHAGWLFVLPFSAIVAGVRYFPDAPLPTILVAAMLGGILSGWPLDRMVFPDFRFCRWIKAAGLLSLVRLGLLALVLVFALSMPAEWSIEQLGWAAAFLASVCALNVGLIYKLMCILGALRPAGERLSRLVQECAVESGIPVKAVWELRTPAGFAAAVVVPRALIFSTTTAAEHNDDELRAICRHELAHLNEGPLMIAVRVAQLPLALLPFIFTATFIEMMGGLGIVPPLLLWLLINRIFARISIRLEKRADQAATRDADSPDYARALERLHRRNFMPAVLAPKASRTHPDLYDRMLAAGFTPDYARPAPPKEWHWLPLTTQILGGITMIAWMTLRG